MKLTTEQIASLLRGMSANKRTSLLGVLLLVKAGLAMYGVALPPEADELVTSAAVGTALLFTRDWAVTSEQSGACKCDGTNDTPPPSALSAPRR